MGYSENEFTLQEFIEAEPEEVAHTPMSFEEEWELFQVREERARLSGQAALFDIVLVDGEVRAELGEA